MSHGADARLEALQRPFTWVNKSDTPCPARGVFRVIQWVLAPSGIVVHGVIPDDEPGVYGVNGPMPVDIEKTGRGTFDFPALAAVETTVVAGDTLGVKDGIWELSTDSDGYMAMGDTINGMCLVMPDRGGSSSRLIQGNANGTILPDQMGLISVVSWATNATTGSNKEVWYPPEISSEPISSGIRVFAYDTGVAREISGDPRYVIVAAGCEPSTALGRMMQFASSRIPTTMKKSGDCGCGG